MVFNKQLGKISRKKQVITPGNIDEKSEVAKNPIIDNLENQTVALGITETPVQSPVKDTVVIDHYALIRMSAWLGML